MNNAGVEKTIWRYETDSNSVLAPSSSSPCHLHQLGGCEGVKPFGTPSAVSGNDYGARGEIDPRGYRSGRYHQTEQSPRHQLFKEESPYEELAGVMCPYAVRDQCVVVGMLEQDRRIAVVFGDHRQDLFGDLSLFWNRKLPNLRGGKPFDILVTLSPRSTKQNRRGEVIPVQFR
jgi:hypothetical protein